MEFTFNQLIAVDLVVYDDTARCCTVYTCGFDVVRSTKLATGRVVSCRVRITAALILTVLSQVHLSALRLS